MLIKKFVVEDVTMVGHIESDPLKITIDQWFQKLFYGEAPRREASFPNISGRCIVACNLRFIGRLREIYWEAEGDLLGGWRRFIGWLKEIYWVAEGDLLGGGMRFIGSLK